MILERIESEGIAHYSYIFGDGNKAAVIDPRRDCEAYIEKASEKNLQITHIFETHRNEDYAIGSVELRKRTGSEIWHADGQLDYKYGSAVKEGQDWRFGRLSLKAIHTPGHTPGSMSYLLDDPNGNPWIIFTGDALFAGDVGRVDLLGLDRMKELAKMLYETIYGKLLPLGDDIIVCPAHGAGSVCGADIAERIWTTIGLEKKYNMKLKYRNKEDFVTEIAKKLDRPPYFKKMEKYNIEGAPILGSLPILRPLSATEFANIANDATIIDTRMETCFGAAHISNSISIWLEGIPAFAGWFLTYDRPILLISESKDIDRATRYLIRLGYDRLIGYLSGGILSWHTAGFESSSIKMMTVKKICNNLDKNLDVMILDVRSEEELEKAGKITNAKHIHLTELLERLDEIPKDQTIYLFCGSGLRSMTAASILKRNGWDDLVVVLGGIAGWNSMTCPIE